MGLSAYILSALLVDDKEILKEIQTFSIRGQKAELFTTAIWIWTQQIMFPNQEATCFNQNVGSEMCC